MLEFLQVKKEYSERIVLSVSELKLSGGIYWLTGANGSGKTTLLKMVSGLIPYSGHILIDGVDLLLKPMEYRKIISIAEAEPRYPPFLTGKDLIRFYQQIRKASLSQTDLLTERLGFGQFLSTPIGTYSSGMLKRLSLLLAFIGTPKWIFLDEPMSNLDAEALKILPEIIMEYHKTYGTHFIFSSHTPFQDENFIVIQKLQIGNQQIHVIA
jgi:ABC-2 type transport system ATP-binding protein